MIFCSKCGSRNDNDATYCNNCGHEIDRPIGKKLDKRMISYLALAAALCLFIIITIWHLHHSDVRFANHSLGKSTDRISEGDTLPSSHDKKKGDSAVPNLQEEAKKAADILIGSDVNDIVLPGEPIPFEPGIMDIEHADSYDYKEADCSRLFSDVAQHLAHSIQSEMAEAMKFSDEEENTLGTEIAEQIKGKFKGKIDTNIEWQRYLQTLGYYLTKRVKRKGIIYQFHVIEDDETNAFAIPGGHIYIYTGLLKKMTNEAQLAAILAHEIEHVDLRHCTALYQVLTKLPGALNNPIAIAVAEMIRHPYSASTEAEADRKSIGLIYSFGYSPYQIVRLFESLPDNSMVNTDKKSSGVIGQIVGQVAGEIENVILTHPKTEKRICYIKNHIVQLQKRYPIDIFYVGEWNYRNRMTLFQQQK